MLFLLIIKKNAEKLQLSSSLIRLYKRDENRRIYKTDTAFEG